MARLADFHFVRHRLLTHISWMVAALNSLYSDDLMGFPGPFSKKTLHIFAIKDDLLNRRNSTHTNTPRRRCQTLEWNCHNEWIIICSGAIHLLCHSGKHVYNLSFKINVGKKYLKKVELNSMSESFGAFFRRRWLFFVDFFLAVLFSPRFVANNSFLLVNKLAYRI